MLEEAPEEWDDDEGDDHPSSLDLMFDQWATLHDGVLSKASTELSAVTLKALSPAMRRPRTELVDGIEAMIPTLLANLMMLHRDRPQGSRLVLQMEHRKKTRYDRPGFRKLPEVITALSESGHIIKHDAVYKKKRTTIEATGKLKATLLGDETTLADIGRAEGEELILLTSRPAKRWVRGVKQPKRLVDYKDTQETIALRKEMEELNRFLSCHAITLEGEPKPAFRLVRQFTLRSPHDPIEFEFHGRLYGGFWMNLKAAERHRIRINGEPIADLDYSNMFPRLAYLEVGRTPPDGDLYAVPGLEDHRAGAKAGLSALLSYPHPMKNLPPRLKQMLPDGWTASRLRTAIADHHPLLVPYFEKDFGLDLMFLESRILLRAMRNLMEMTIPALPMHDGMMVPRSKAQLTKEAMEMASCEILGFRLPVAAKN